MRDELPGERRAWRTEDEWSRLRDRIAAEPLAPRSVVRMPWRWTAAAAVVAVAVGLTVALRHRAAPAAVEHVFHTALGERLIVQLGDSSTVTLGPATTLRVASSPARRDVKLDGLGAFNIVHDAARPFVVLAGGARTRDVGTRFTVRAYAADSDVRVAVTEGVVALTSDAKAGPPLVLRAGDVAAVGRTGVAHVESSANATADAAWVNGGLSFDDVPLAQVAAELERWFDVDIQIRDTTFARRHVTAVYRDAHLADVLNALAATLHFDYDRSGRTIVIHDAARETGASK